MHGCLSHERNVCPSVCPSIRVDCDQTKESSAQIFISHERKFILVLRQEEWLAEADRQ